MRGRQGTESFRQAEDADDAAYGRWASVSLVVLLHAGLYLLLRGSGEAAPPAPHRVEERIRLVWSPRMPARAGPVPSADVSFVKAPSASAPSIPAATMPVPARPPRGEVLVPASPAAPVPHVGQADAWSMDAPPGAVVADGNRFRRDPFARAGPDPFAQVQHLPGLRMRDRSLGGWLQAQAQLRACAELKVALRRQPESTQALMASMERWECTF